MGVPIPAVETGIASSAVVLGLMVALAVRPPLWIAAVIVGAFAIFHGHAHGTELPDAANPLATILSLSMMLRFAFSLEAEAAAIDAAVKSVLASGYRTGDIYVGEGTKVGCTEMGNLVVDAI